MHTFFQALYNEEMCNPPVSKPGRQEVSYVFTFKIASFVSKHQLLTVFMNTFLVHFYVYSAIRNCCNDLNHCCCFITDFTVVIEIKQTSVRN